MSDAAASAPTPPSVRLSGGLIARSAGLAVATLVGGVLATIVLFLLLQVAFGPRTGSGLFVRGALTQLLTLLLSVLVLLLGILSVAALARGGSSAASARAALHRGLASLPRVAVVLLGAAVALALSAEYWVYLSAGVLLAAGVRSYRNRSRSVEERTAVRPVLLLAIPFAPLLMIVGTAVNVLALGLDRPASLKALLSRACRRTWTAPLATAVLALAVAVISGAASGLGLLASSVHRSATDGPLRPAVALGLALIVLIVLVGFALARLGPAATAGGVSPGVRPAPRGARSRLLRWGSLTGRTAMVAAIAVAGALLPSPGYAALSPTLTISVTGQGPSPAITAQISVPGGSAAGTVQFLDDATTSVGTPVSVSTAAADPSTGTAVLDPAPVLSPGVHQLSFRFTPQDSTSVSAGDSNAVRYVVPHPTTTSVSLPAGATVGASAQVDVTVATTTATDPASVPTGDVQVSTGTEQATLTLTNGQATWNVSALGQSVSASYQGAELYEVSSTQVSTTRAATTLSVGDPGMMRIHEGAFFDLTVSLADLNSAPRPTGRVEVTEAGSSTVLESAAIVDGSGYLNLQTGPTPGVRDLLFTYIPDPGFAASERAFSLNVGKAASEVEFSGTPGRDQTLTFGDTHLVHVTARSVVEETRTAQVEIYDTRTGAQRAVATGPVVIKGGVGTADIDVTGKLPTGTTSYTVVLLETATAEYASRDSYITNTILPRPTSVALTTSGPASAGTPVTLQALVRDSSGTPVPGSVRFLAAGVPLGSGTAGSDGIATLAYTPSSAGTVVISAEYRATTAPASYEPSTATLSVVVAGATAPAPVISWGDTVEDFGAGFPYGTLLRIEYPTSDPAPAVTGTVEIRDVFERVLATMAIGPAGAAARIDLAGTSPTLHAVYLGDSSYNSRSDAVPAPPSLPASVTLTGSTPVQLGNPVHLQSTLSGVSASTVKSARVLGTGPDGALVEVGTLSYSQGRAFTEFRPTRSGTYRLHVVVEYLPSSVAGLTRPASSSPTFVLEIRPAAAPVLTLSSPTRPLIGGSPVTLDLRASAPAGRALSIADGATAEVFDGEELVGSILLRGGSSGDLTGSLTLERLTGGTHRFTAKVGYGTEGETVRGPVLLLELAATPVAVQIAADSVEVGTPLEVQIRLYPNPVKVLPRVVYATVTFAGVTQRVALTEAPAGTHLSGQLSLPTPHAGTSEVRVETDPLPELAGGVASATVTIQRRATAIEVLRPSPVGGEKTTVGALLRQVGTSTSPRPTGPVVVRVHGRTDATCTITSPLRFDVCDLPAGAIRTGDNTVELSYAGDEDNAPSTVVLTVRGPVRTSALTATFDPPASDWVAGQKVKVSWTTRTDSGTPLGSVTLSLGGAPTCSGAPTGSCTFTLPEARTQSPSVAYQLLFASSDDAPYATLERRVALRFCAYPTIHNGRIELVEGSRCGTNDAGFVTGSTVTAHARAAEQYVLTGWNVGGQHLNAAVDATGEYVTSFRVWGSHAVGYQSEYSPTCVTLKVSPGTQLYRGDLPPGHFDYYGYLYLATPSNCGDPRFSTAIERELESRGIGSYAKGTPVTLVARPRWSNWQKPDPVGDPEIVVDQVTGATPGSHEGVYTVVMDGNRSVDATFKVAACTPFSIAPSEGGTLRVASSQRPESSKHLLPASGACTSVQGPGYVPGTTLTMQATPAKDHFFVGTGTYHHDRDLRQVTIAGARVLGVPSIALGEKPTATPPLSFTLTPGGRIGAQFSAVDCVAVTIRTAAPRPSHSAAPDEIAFNRQGDCVSTPGSRTSRTDGNYRFTTQTEWFIRANSVLVADRHEFGESRKPYDETLPYPMYPFGRAAVSWSTNVPLAEQQAAYRNVGPVVDLAMVAAGTEVLIDAEYHSEYCSTPNVQNPQNGTWRAISATPNQPYCGPGQLTRGQAGYLVASALPGTDPKVLTPVFSFPDRSHRTQAPPVSVQWHLPQFATVRLEYCAKLPVTLKILDINGKASTGTQHQVAKYLTDDGECPSGMSRPNRTAKISLSPEGEYFYTQVGASPSVRIDAQGRTGPAVDLTIQVRCQRLTVGERIQVNTPGDCPGDPGRHTRGSVVEMQAAPHSGERFNHFSGTDSEFGVTAYVLLDRDRYVGSDVTKPDFWEKLGNGLSNFAQRIVSFGGTIITGLAMAQMFLMTGAAAVMSGLAAVLDAAGVHADIVAGLNYTADIVSATGDLLGLAASCMGSWSHGSSITALPTLGGGDASVDVAIGESTDRVQAAVEKRLAQSIANGNKAAGSAERIAGTFGYARDAVDNFVSNPDMYNRPAAQGWNEFGGSMGSCMAAGFQETVEGVITPPRPSGR